MGCRNRLPLQFWVNLPGIGLIHPDGIVASGVLGVEDTHALGRAQSVARHNPILRHLFPIAQPQSSARTAPATLHQL